MSMAFLKALNAGRTGLLREFIDDKNREPNICWYPSAGNDLRDLYYLSRQYAEQRQHDHDLLADELFPDIFVHTDFWPFSDNRFIDSIGPGNSLFNNGRTRITVRGAEELGRISLPDYSGLTYLTPAPLFKGRVIFLLLDVVSERHEHATLCKIPLLYIFAENLSFFKHVMLSNRAKLSHAVHIRYGGGMGGGGTSAGGWMCKVLGAVNCRYLVSDGRHHCWQSGDDLAMKYLPESDRVPFLPGAVIREIPGRSWSEYSDSVVWIRSAHT